MKIKKWICVAIIFSIADASLLAKPGASGPKPPTTPPASSPGRGSTPEDAGGFREWATRFSDSAEVQMTPIQCETQGASADFSDFCDQAKSCQTAVKPLVQVYNTGKTAAAKYVGGAIGAIMDLGVGTYTTARDSVSAYAQSTRAGRTVTESFDRIRSIASDAQARIGDLKAKCAQAKEELRRRIADLRAAGDSRRAAEIEKKIAEFDQLEKLLIEKVQTSEIAKTLQSARELAEQAQRAAQQLQETFREAYGNALEVASEAVRDSASTTGSAVRSNVNSNFQWAFRFYNVAQALGGDGFQQLGQSMSAMPIGPSCADAYPKLMDSIGSVARSLARIRSHIWETPESFAFGETLNPIRRAANRMLTALNPGNSRFVARPCKLAYERGMTVLRLAARSAETCRSSLKPEDISRLRYIVLTAPEMAATAERRIAAPSAGRH